MMGVGGWTAAQERHDRAVSRDEDDDPYGDLPFGEQQREIDWLETRNDSFYPPDPPEFEDWEFDC